MSFQFPVFLFMRFTFLESIYLPLFNKRVNEEFFYLEEKKLIRYEDIKKPI